MKDKTASMLRLELGHHCPHTPFVIVAHPYIIRTRPEG